MWTLSTPGDGVAVATYSNPEMNYFTLEAAQELGQLIESWHTDRSLRAIVLCGDGRSTGFITHFSVETLEQIASDPDAARDSAEVSRGYHALLDGLNRLPQAVIAAMNGDTMGGGFELSLACDIRIGQNGDHRYGLPEARLGIMPGGGGTQRLPRLIGPARALELVLRGRVVDPVEALRLGMVHELADDAVERATRVATEIAALPSTSVANIKTAVYQGTDTTLAEGLDIESDSFQNTMLSDDARERMRAYLAVPEPDRRAWLESDGRSPTGE
ncbi:enoyl-CoA hydratase/isomerase family protein [Pseudonocardia spinosispora]|uniref:enoyl-CoA hydratase/isomerase family protein n=1 Tax=Pseudonocardia spinosispora TaxID=103441 RepID=UPI00068651BB|nr:enoyl-CoA hydratase/isomerase family protein [Pseudonocardia spinosispora]